jgi:hypothetical protein
VTNTSKHCLTTKTLKIKNKLETKDKTHRLVTAVQGCAVDEEVAVLPCTEHERVVVACTERTHSPIVIVVDCKVKRPGDVIGRHHNDTTVSCAGKDMDRNGC